MRLLLDTHIFLWWITGDSRLSASTLSTVRDPANRVFLSVVSVWECLIKHGTGKLALPSPPDRFLVAERIRHGLEPLPLDEESVSELIRLPPIHRDPFDRMLICQALRHG